MSNFTIRCPHCGEEIACIPIAQVRALTGAVNQSLRKHRGAGPGRPKKPWTCAMCGIQGECRRAYEEHYEL